MRQLERHCQCHSHWHWHRPRAAGQGPIRTRRARAGSIQRYQLWYVLGSDELGALPGALSMICWSLWVSLSWLGILFPVIFTYVHPQGQVTVTVATFVVYTKRHHVPEKFSQRWLSAQWGLL